MSEAAAAAPASEAAPALSKAEQMKEKLAKLKARRVRYPGQARSNKE